MSHPKRISVVSGGFDPIHAGHISYLKNAANYGDYLIVALNSDNWLKNKKGKYFLNFDERKLILENLTFVDEVLSFEDDRKGSCINALEDIKKKYTKSKILFCNGGDRNDNNIPEMIVDGIEFIFSVGGDEKINSSSSLLKNWNFDSEERTWGVFYNLFIDKKLKVKELIINPSKGMSFQRHQFRNELWFISQGECYVNFSESDPYQAKEIRLKSHDIFHVKKNQWHQIINKSNKVCKIIEIQYGEKTSEDDIERLFYYEENEKKSR